MNSQPKPATAVIAIPALLLTGLLGACASTTPHYDAHFGEAVRQTLSAQVIDPRAGESPDPVTGMDGGSSREAIQRYRESFKAPPPAANVINIGGAR
jgi:type IV pilus biogenesis protein CpaD/CtpE